MLNNIHVMDIKQNRFLDTNKSWTNRSRSTSHISMTRRSNKEEHSKQSFKTLHDHHSILKMCGVNLSFQNSAELKSTVIPGHVTVIPGHVCGNQCNVRWAAHYTDIYHTLWRRKKYKKVLEGPPPPPPPLPPPPSPPHTLKQQQYKAAAVVVVGGLIVFNISRESFKMCVLVQQGAGIM